ncbi:lysophospholipid acyltransferase family protein [Candidatus Paracaedibacter symbiosus]|uniref:lysophospholipid acyltransferase family protein n=1 Tax=Candidatus Paracaedibacter symbiosus TaxID=244582 RepID=UPI000509AB57|nr:hypothetical protein [Candidatus Paracaedibacter symbiosus]
MLIQKKIFYLFEYSLIYIFCLFCRLFSLKTASAIGGGVGRILLKFVRNGVKQKNLAQAIPNLDKKTEHDILQKCDENFGRNFVEYFFLDRLNEESDLKVTIKTPEIIEHSQQNDRPKIVITAHYGNWEIALWAMGQAGISLNPIYRQMNNPYVNEMILKLRSHITEHQIKKGSTAGKDSLRILRQGKNLVLLVDQKMNEGVAVPFFGKDAMTPSGVIKLALLSNAEIIPARIIRKNSIDFDIFLEPPIEYDKSSPTVTYDTLLKINQTLEKWILDKPEQWFWFHRRWEKPFYQKQD